MHMHLLETAYQKEYARRRGGGTAVDYIRDHGMLGPLMTVGHGTWLTEHDIELLADSGTHVCHNASSNLRLRSGIAPVNRLEVRGVNVALGIDEAGINDDRDMLQEMRMVLKLHREPGFDDDVPTSPQVLRMATENGARTTPFGDTIGKLEVGRAADLVVMSWRDIAYPFLDLDLDVSVVDAVVHRAKTSGVKTVIVGGEPILHDGRFTRVDKAVALDELAVVVGETRERGRDPSQRAQSGCTALCQAVLRGLLGRGAAHPILWFQLPWLTRSGAMHHTPFLSGPLEWCRVIHRRVRSCRTCDASGLACPGTRSHWYASGSRAVSQRRRGGTPLKRPVGRHLCHLSWRVTNVDRLRSYHGREVRNTREPRFGRLHE